MFSGQGLFLSHVLNMLMSKSFGYALRGVLYVALQSKKGSHIQLAEMATRLHVPRYFMAKIMKKIVKQGILQSAKGPGGGFALTPTTGKTKLIELLEITDGNELFTGCVLHFRKCNSKNPCPLHFPMYEWRNGIMQKLSETTVADLLDKKKPDVIKSIMVI